MLQCASIQDKDCGQTEGLLLANSAAELRKGYTDICKLSIETIPVGAERLPREVVTALRLTEFKKSLGSACRHVVILRGVQFRAMFWASIFVVGPSNSGYSTFPCSPAQSHEQNKRGAENLTLSG